MASGECVFHAGETPATDGERAVRISTCEIGTGTLPGDTLALPGSAPAFPGGIPPFPDAAFAFPGLASKYQMRGVIGDDEIGQPSDIVATTFTP